MPWPSLPKPTSVQPFTSARQADFDPWQYWIPIGRHSRLILSLFFVAEILTAVVVLSMTRLYKAESTIVIEDQMPELLENKVVQQQYDPNADSFYKTQYEVLKNRGLAARVIHDLGLDKDPYFSKPARMTVLLSWLGSFLRSKHTTNASQDDQLLGVEPRVIDAYLKGLTIQPAYQTRLIRVGYSSPDPVLSARIANAHVRAFVRQTYEIHAQNNSLALQFLKSNLDELEKRTERSEAALNDYRRQRGIIAFSIDDKDKMVSDRIVDLNRSFVKAEEARIALQANVQTIKGNDYDSVPAVVSNPLIQNLKIQLSRLGGQYANLASQATAEYPPLVQLHAQMLEAQTRLHQETKRVIDSMEARYQQAFEKEKELRGDLEREKSDAMALKDASLRDVVLAREVDTNRALYQSVLERIKMLGMASEAHVTNISLVNRADVPVFSYSPRKGLSLVVSGILALLLGVGASFWMEGADNALKSAEEVYGYLHLPTLATVPRFTRGGETGSSSKRLLPMYLSNGNGKQLAVANGTNKLVPVVGPYHSAAGEAYRAVRTSILLSRSDRPLKIILFSSAMAGEGKSVTAINTAIAFANMKDRVLLIDADLRRPRCHEILDQKVDPGLAEVLAGVGRFAESVRPTGVKGLFLLSAGSSPANPSELLGSAKMRELLDQALSSYEHVLIDSAPILPVSDAVILSPLTDSVVLVSGCDTAKQLVRDACLRLLNVGAQISGVVLNNVDPEHRRYYARYYARYESYP